MDKLIQTLEEKSFNEAQAYIDQVMVRAEEMKEKMIEEAKGKIEKRHQRYEKEANIRKNQEITRVNMKARNETNLVKEQYVSQIINECKEYYKNLTQDGYIGLLKQMLDIRDDGEEHPKLYVCEHHFETVKKEFGQEYQVIGDPNLVSGFVFSYDMYDANFEIDQLFQFHHQEISKKVLSMLFKEGLDE